MAFCRNLVLTLLLIFSTIPIGAQLSAEVRRSKQITSDSPFPEDHLELVIRNNGKVVNTEYFYSSYGEATAQIVCDATGNTFILLRHGTGRGTHVRTEDITVYKLGKALNEVVTFPISGPADINSSWEYSMKINKPQSGGLEFNLSRILTGTGATKYYPEDKERVILIK